MKELRQLRFIGFVEGWSYLLLLLVAMPLKYFFDLPQAVRVVGMAHGVLFVLFVLFVLAMVRAAAEHEWPLKRYVVTFAASLIPWGTFWLNKQLTREIEGQGP